MILAKKIGALALAVCMTVASVGCSSSTTEETAATTSEGTEQTAEGEDTQTDAQTNGDGTFTIVDDGGFEVTLPENIERVVITSPMPLPSIYCLFRGSAEGLVGMHPSSMSAAENSFLPQIVPDVLNASTDFVENGEINIEELMALEPDVVFYMTENVSQREMFEKAGIPCVGFSTENYDYNCIDNMEAWIELLGRVFREESKAQGIIEYAREVYSEIEAKVQDIPEDQKPKVLMIYNYSNGVVQTSGDDHYGRFWIDSCGGVNAAAGLAGAPEVSMEQIYEWNPDMIFVSNFTEYLPEDFYNNTIEGQDWSNVKAVQEGKVYKFPLGMYRWYPPSPDTPLTLMWLAQKMQPEVFAYIDMDQEIKDYFQEFYGVTLTDEDVQTIYNPAREAAAGYIKDK